MLSPFRTEECLFQNFNLTLNEYELPYFHPFMILDHDISPDEESEMDDDEGNAAFLHFNKFVV